jgi:glyoxylase-like metal-dependent hydrolase (beta-lactamase superfamily II)
MKRPLKWDVFVSSQIPAITSDLPPGVSEMKWSPISSTLISGEREAVLVDTFITMDQNRSLAEWVAASGKNLTPIYATHGRGDHFFGLSCDLPCFKSRGSPLLLNGLDRGN